MQKLKIEQWRELGTSLFGPNSDDWRFVCPNCGYMQSVGDCKRAGHPSNAIAFSCIGRTLGTKNELRGTGGPCNYSGGGLFKLNPIEVSEGDHATMFFDFDRSDSL